MYSCVSHYSTQCIVDLYEKSTCVIISQTRGDKVFVVVLPVHVMVLCIRMSDTKSAIVRWI